MAIWAIFMFFVLVAMLLLGYPIAFTLGAVSLLFGTLFLGIDFFNLLPLQIWGIMNNFTLLAVPLFIFMGMILDQSGLAENLIKTMGLLFGRIRGGLAISVILVGMLLAATTGVVGATVVTMGVIALPTMLKYAYSRQLATATVAAAGTLGQIIPPSIILVLLGDMIGVPIGKLFIAAIIPSALLVSLFVLYILIITWKNPEMAPALLPKKESEKITAWQVTYTLLPPLLLIFVVLGSLFFGFASPTESAAVGALGAMLLAACNKKLKRAALQTALRQTTQLTSMVFLILIGATAFGLVFKGMGGDRIILDAIGGLPGGKLSFLLVSMAILFLLGFFLDFLQICFIVVPVLAPIAAALGIDLLWFAILIGINLQTSFLTPPFGFSLFYLKAVAPAEVKISDIYKGVIPFIGLQVIVIIMIACIPELVTWLPALMDKAQGL